MNKTIIILIVLISMCATAEAQQWRLQSKANSWGNITSPNKRDSVHFYYSPSSSRGSEVSYKATGTGALSYYNDKIWCDSSHSYEEVRSDTTKWATIKTTLKRRCVRNYDNADNLLSSKYYSANALLVEDRYTYDTFGNCIKVEGPNYEYLYSYDSQGRLIKSDYILANINRHSTEEYTYNSNNLIVKDTSYSSHITSSSSNYFYYDNNNNKVRTVSYKYDTSSISAIDSTTIYNIYNQAGSLIKDSIVNTIAPHVIVSYSYYPNGMLKDVDEGILFTSYTYTSFDYINSITVLRPATSNQYTVFFHYEHYWPAGVASAVKNEAELKVYPVPANNLLHVEADFKEGGKLQGSVTDMQGRVVYHWNDDATKNYKKQIYLNHLPSGIYMLQLHADNEMATKQFIKQ